MATGSLKNSNRKRNVIAASAGFALALLPNTLLAQADLIAANVTTPSNPPAVARSTFSFDLTPNTEYTLGPGDQLHIAVAGRPEIATEYIVGPDGRITFPIAGVIDLGGLTRKQAAQAVEAAMAPYYLHPSATVGINQYVSNHVLLLGDVQHPGLQSYDHQPTLLEVISRGGVGSTADSGFSSISTIAAHTENKSIALPERAFVYRGTNQVAEVDLRQLLAGNSFQDLYLQRGDVVLIPVVNDLVSILGAVKSPGAVRFAAQSSLANLIAEAGGLDDKAGGNPTIRIVNPANKTVQEVEFKRLLDPKATNDISLHAGDVIFVPTSAFGKFAYVVDKMNPVTTVIGFALAYHR